MSKKPLLSWSKNCLTMIIKRKFFVIFYTTKFLPKYFTLNYSIKKLLKIGKAKGHLGGFSLYMILPKYFLFSLRQ